MSNLPDSDSGDEFSNNLFSDLAPLLALFGEQVAKQFMSESMGWADNIIFAMAPIGVITAIVSAIRVGGSTWLKALIGRAKENHAFAEMELMSSTSNEVCEMWNGQHVVRMMGAPAIKELIYIRNRKNKESVKSSGKVDSEPGDSRQAHHSSGSFKPGGGGGGSVPGLPRPGLPRSRSSRSVGAVQSDNGDKIWMLEQAKNADVLVKDDGGALMQTVRQLTFNSTMSSRNRKFTERAADLEHQFRMSMPQSPDSTFTSATMDDTMRDDPPNISLNMHTRVGRAELRIIAVMGILLQLGVLVYDGIIAYYPGFKQKKGSNEMARYAFPITSAGTLILVLGMLICAYIIERSTTEESYKVKDADIYMLWLQKAGAVNDQMFESYVLLARDKRDIVTTSRRAKRSFGGVADPGDKSVSTEILTAFGSAVSVIGFVLQFVGLRAMHWSASISQLVATVIMLILRAYVRRGLSGRPYWQQVPKGHEIDWLATRTAEDKERLWRIPDCNEPDIRPRSRDSSVIGKLWGSPGKGDGNGSCDGFWSQNCFKWGISTIKDIHRYQALKSGGSSQRIKTRAMKVVEARVDLGGITTWYGPAVNRALSVASAIETVMNRLYPSHSEELSLVWSIYDKENNEVQLNLWRPDGGSPWRANLGEIEAVLSLWLFSVAQQELDTGATKLQEGIDGLRTGMTSRNHGLRLLGPIDPSVSRYMRCWLGSDMALVRGATMLASSDRSIRETVGAENSERNNTVEFFDIEFQSTNESLSRLQMQFESHRIVGYESKDNPSTFAVISDAPLDLLYAQDLFSAFMWSFVRSPSVEQIGGVTTVKESVTVADSGRDNVLESVTFHNTELLRVAEMIYQTGLGSVGDILHSIIPPLIVEDKLPDMCAVVRFARDKGRVQESYRRWETAGDIYVGALKACSGLGLGHQEQAVYEATCALTEFIRQLSIEIDVTEEYRGSEFGLLERHDRTSELKKLQEQMVKELKSHAQPKVLQAIGEVYRRQDRHEGVSLWKPRTLFSPYLFYARPEPPPLRQAPNYWSDLHDAAAAGVETNLEELFRNPGVEPDPRDFAGLTPLHHARQYPVAKKLLSYGAAVDAKGHDGFTPLHSAARRGIKDIVQLLIEHGADLNARDTNRRTPLHWAAWEGQNEVVEHLLKNGADPDPIAEHGRKPLHMAACGGHHTAVTAILMVGEVDINTQDGDGRTALHLAAVGGHDALVSTLANAQRDDWVKDRFGWTAIHLAAFKSLDKVIQAFLEPQLSGNDQDNPELLSEEIERRMNVRSSNDGASPLHTAVRWGHMSTVKLLLDKGAPKEAKDEAGNTALTYATIYHRQYDLTKYQQYGMIRYLLDNGCNIESTNSEGLTPLHHAVHFDGKGYPEAVRLLLKRKAKIDPKDLDGNTPLHRASAHGDTAVMSVLLEHKADIQIQNNKGSTALHQAAELGHEEAVKLLLEHGADVQAKDGDESTALHVATRHGRLPVIRALLKTTRLGLDAESKIGGTALDIAVVAGDLDMVKVFVKAGASICVGAGDKEGTIESANDDEVRDYLRKRLLARGG